MESAAGARTRISRISVSRLVIGRAVFVRPTAGVLTSVARNGDPAPGGGTITTVTAVSDVNAAGDVAFLATVDGAASGAFRYDAALTTTATVARIGDATGDGRQFCDITAVDVGDSGRSVLHTVTKVNCADGGEPALDGVYAQSGGGFIAVVREGDATPITATTYSKFVGTPEINASDVVGFRAKTAGFEHITGLFNFDSVGPTTTALVVTGDSAPGSFARSPAASDQRQSPGVSRSRHLGHEPRRDLSRRRQQRARRPRHGSGAGRSLRHRRHLSSHRRGLRHR